VVVASVSRGRADNLKEKTPVTANMALRLWRLRRDACSLRADAAADMIEQENRLNVQIAGLHRAVIENPSSAIGHGIRNSRP
jgi:hypothetical protein